MKIDIILAGVGTRYLVYCRNHWNSCREERVVFKTSEVHGMSQQGDVQSHFRLADYEEPPTSFREARQI